MSEFLYHATGLCGHVHHPSLINITAIVLVVSVVATIVYKRVKR